MKLLKDYDYKILYHFNKAIVNDVLSYISIGNLAYKAKVRRTLIAKIYGLEVKSMK